MKKQVILLMEKQFPFGQFQFIANKKPNIGVKTLVRKVHETKSLQERNEILDKVNVLKSLSTHALIKIQTVLQEENSIHLLYQYVPIKFQKNFQGNKTQSVSKIKEEIINFGIQLAQIGIFAQWHLQNLGLDSNYQGKYYLDIDKMQIGKKSQNKNIRKIQLQNINSLFQKTIEDERKSKIKKIRKKSSSPDQKQIDAFYQNQTQLLEKTEQNKQKVKKKDNKNMKKSSNHWKQIQQDDEILRDFINVLDDEKSDRSEKVKQEQEDEQVIWNEPVQNGQETVEEMVWIDSQEIRKKANEAIQRSLKAIKIFRQIVLKKH